MTHSRIPVGHSRSSASGPEQNGTPSAVGGFLDDSVIVGIVTSCAFNPDTSFGRLIVPFAQTRRRWKLRSKNRPWKDEDVYEKNRDNVSLPIISDHR